MNVEQLIFSQLLCNESYSRAVMPHLKEEYFNSSEEKEFFKIYSKFFQTHNKVPSKQAMLVEIESMKASAEVYTGMSGIVTRSVEFSESLEYLMDKTEEYCKNRAVFNALKKSVLIADGQDKKHGPESIPTILQEALSVCFNTKVGHDYMEDAESRFDYYHLSTARISLGENLTFNKITKNGLPRKTLNVLLAPPHGGKSLCMINLADGALNDGYNVLYLTLEMAEEEIAKRFDVKQMGIDFDTLDVLPKSTFMGQIEKIKAKSRGRLIIKEYPTNGASCADFRAFLNDAKTKQKFVPDLIVVDYLQLVNSEVYKAGSNHNSYTVIGSIAKELRKLAILEECAVLTAVQTNRAGVGNSDVDMSNTSDSFAVPAHADLFIAIINTEELVELNQIMFKQLKNRYNGIKDYDKFILGIDIPKMTLIELEPNGGVSTPRLNKEHSSTLKFLTSSEPIIQTVHDFSDFNFDS